MVSPINVPDSQDLSDACIVVLANYVRRKIFTDLRSQRIGVQSKKYTFKWHFDRTFEIVVDLRAQKYKFNCILPDVVKESRLDTDFRRYIRSHVGKMVPVHKRIAKNSESVRIINRNGSVSLSVAAENRAPPEVAGLLVGVGHQIYTQFLRRGGYDDYLVETLKIDIDSYM